MKDQQSKAVEKAASKIAGDLYTRPLTEIDSEWKEFNEYKSIATQGIQEVIDHPEKYGLAPWQQNKKIVDKIDHLEAENKRLRGALQMIYDDPETWSHLFPSQQKAIEQALNNKHGISDKQ